MARRTAAQRRATRKLVALNRRRKRGKVKSRRSPTRRRKTRRRTTKRRTSKRKRRAPTRRRKSNKKRSSSDSMVFGKKIPIISNPAVRKAATGIGIATIGVTLLALVAPQIAANPIVRPALAFIGGGIPGVIASVFLQGGAQLGGLLGGGGGGGGGAAA